jgi:peptidoglycan/xylan/chitin deacetylase (PgdA/CDA1 family)
MMTSSVVWADSPKATILLYHGLTEKCPEEKKQKRADRFYNDMMYIKENFDVISLHELQDIIENQRMLERNTVVITFDDGLKSDYTIAAPILKEFGFPATFFVVTDWREDEDYMSWEQIKELSQVTNKDGEYLFTIGSHSRSHRYPGLQNLTGAELRSELEDSKHAIEQHIAPRTCTAFAVPYGILPQSYDEFYSLATEFYEIIRTSASRNINIATDWLLNLPCLPLYDFTEPEYIGAFNQSLYPITTPFFDPVQDVYYEKSYVIRTSITGIEAYVLSGNDGIVIEAVSDNNVLIKNLTVDYTPPRNMATIWIEINEGYYGRAKISLKVSAPGAFHSSGYFYVNVESPVSVVSHMYIYPNPATDYIEIMNADAYIRYSIYNIVGQLLKQGQGNRIDIGFLPQGIYIINIDADKKTSQLKFIKN